MFADKLDDVINESEVVFIAVGIPPGEDGSADLAHVLEVFPRTNGRNGGFVADLTFLQQVSNQQS